MEYVKPSLHLLNLDEFTYPELHVHVGIETYGGLDREEIVSVFFQKVFAGRWTSHYVFQEQTHLVNVKEIRAEVAAFNQDPKSHWDAVILGLLEKQASDTMDQIMSRVKSLKVIRQNMEKFTTGKG